MNKKINKNEIKKINSTEKYKKEIEEEIARLDFDYEILKEKQHSLRMAQIASRNNSLK